MNVRPDQNELPRWCSHCAINGYHRPENCPERKPEHMGRMELIRTVERLRAALDRPLRETILAVLTTMPSEAAPEHLAAMIERQVQAWQGNLVSGEEER